ncbi:hypothetical protein MUN81_03840 [Hymenobacter sp. 5317J-9]|uniref:hypothetical protein n=1 Tax=Hymenobacter sp. 5317J-9 TaxID=2932250 RepID=UPI001FD64C68|nr:hypothetical protein [Hymenobacter sp. 5317J-9]UOQ98628.1 hypothetical protein MUN81_03840 [Hymenobacter sp. 5317J-9]
MSSQDQPLLNLSKDEALVLFEFLHRINSTDQPELFEDQAEQRALWNVECLLEKQLPELLQANFATLVAEARTRLRDEE